MVPDELPLPDALPGVDEEEAPLSLGESALGLEPDIEPEPLMLPLGVLLLDEELLPGAVPGALLGVLPVAPVEPLLLYAPESDVRGSDVLSPHATRLPKASAAAAAIKVFFISISFSVEKKNHRRDRCAAP